MVEYGVMILAAFIQMVVIIPVLRSVDGVYLHDIENKKVVAFLLFVYVFMSFVSLYHIYKVNFDYEVLIVSIINSLTLMFITHILKKEKFANLEKELYDL